jgi:hypothetical protein
MYGVSNAPSHAAKCLCAIQGLAIYYSVNSIQLQELDSVATIILQQILMQPFEVDLLPDAANALLAIWTVSNISLLNILSSYKGSENSAHALQNAILSFQGDFDSDLNSYHAAFFGFVTEMKELVLV